jgi:ribonuclease J
MKWPDVRLGPAAIAVPTHGMRRHLMEHAAFARDCGTPETVTPAMATWFAWPPDPRHHR